MNKPLFVFAGLFLALLVACSDTDSGKAAGVTTEPNSSAWRDVRDSVLDALAGKPGYNQETTDSIPTTSSSKADYMFTTEKTPYTTSPDTRCYINLYKSNPEKEIGVQMFGGDKKGSYFLTSLVMPDEGVLLQLISVAYFEGKALCQDDLVLFQEECLQNNGIFRDFGDNCIKGKQDAACALPWLPETDWSQTLETEAKRYELYCNSTFEPEEPECTVICKFDGESHCDTTCPNSDFSN